MTGRGAAFAAIGCALAFLLAGCDQPKVYKQGQYQGKEDAKPWNNSQFNGNQVEWEKAIKARNQGQDEYTRAVASAK
jgi:hypothetical protein